VIDLGRAISAALTAAHSPAPARVSLILSDDRDLAALNREHMGEDGPTDVLAFPLLPPAAYPPHPGQDPHVRAAEPGFALPPRSRLHVGDIVVSVERAVEQAQSGGAEWHKSDASWSPAHELRLLVVHGTLHICGWDHRLAAEEKHMRALEARILGGLA
jgi:probable rRNA maturation factor